MTTTTLGYAPNRPTRRPSINFRMIAFLAVAASPFLWFLYVFLDSTLTGGIHQHKGYAEVDLKSLGYFQFDQDAGTLNDVPAKWRALDGKKIELKGFMWAPTAAGPGVRDFQFVYSITKCCFGGPPLVQERVFAHVPDNARPAPYYGDMCRMVGTLHVNLEKDPAAGKITKLYSVDVESLEAIQ